VLPDMFWNFNDCNEKRPKLTQNLHFYEDLPLLRSEMRRVS
jgi:hypothetical protein